MRKIYISTRNQDTQTKTGWYVNVTRKLDSMTKYLRTTTGWAKSNDANVVFSSYSRMLNANFDNFWHVI